MLAILNHVIVAYAHHLVEFSQNILRQSLWFYDFAACLYLLVLAVRQFLTAPHQFTYTL